MIGPHNDITVARIQLKVQSNKLCTARLNCQLDSYAYAASWIVNRR